MKEEFVTLTFKGSDQLITSIRSQVQDRTIDANVRVSELIVGDPASTLTIIASSLAIIDLLVRWIDQSNALDNDDEKVTVTLPNGKKIDLRKENVDQLEQDLRQILDLSSQSKKHP